MLLRVISSRFRSGPGHSDPAGHAAQGMLRHTAGVGDGAFRSSGVEVVPGAWAHHGRGMPGLNTIVRSASRTVARSGPVLLSIPAW